MPIYEYLCQKCGHEFEREQRITADPIKTCPACKARKVKKLISQTSFVLKGGGWYNDLYSSAKKGDESDAPESKSDSDSTKSESDSKDKKSEKKSSGDSDDKGKKGKKGKQKSNKSAA